MTFDGIAKACAKAGGFPEPELVHFNPKDFDFPKGSKAFPMRDQHFFASIHKVGPVTESEHIIYRISASCRDYIEHGFRSSVVQAQQELGWNPEFSLVDGLRDSYEKDFGRGTYRKEADFTTDDLILAKHK